MRPSCRLARFTTVVSIGAEPLKLHTLYGPPEHRDASSTPPGPARGAPEAHFDGRTTQ